MKSTLTLLLSMCVAAGAFADRDYVQTREASADGVVEIYNRSGSLVIEGWDRNEVHVEGNLGSNIKEVEFDSSSSRTEINVVPARPRSSASAKLIIRVPFDSDLEIKTVSASVDVHSVYGRSIEIETTSGSVELDRCPGDLEVETVSAQIRISGAEGDLELETVSAQILVDGRPRNVRAQTVSSQIIIAEVQESIEAQTVSAQIRVRGDNLEDVQLETVSGAVDFEGTLDEDGDLEISTVSGAVTVDFFDDVEGDYELSSFSGSITCEFDSGQRNRGSKELSFTVGDGDASVQVESFSGSVRIR